MNQLSIRLRNQYSRKEEAYLEFHGRKLVKNVAHGLADGSPRDFVVRLGSRLYCMASHVIESDHVAQHTHSLVEWAETIVGRVTVIATKSYPLDLQSS